MMSKAKLQTLLRSPLFWILVAAAVLRLTGLVWGMPGSDGWDDDGVAPRNFLVGLAQTYAPGKYFTYPPLEMIFIAIPSLPVLLVALLHAPALTGHDVIAEMIKTPYMTYFAVVARLITIAMSLATIVIVAKMAELIGGKRAGWFAAAALTINAAFTYYSQVTNLDGPYLFWSALSLLSFMRLFTGHDLKQLRYGVLAAAAAVATKDQAYAVFLCALPAALAVWFALDDWPVRNARMLGLALLKWGGIAILLVLLVDGAIINPTGFAARVAFLTGPASQDYAQYTRDSVGLAALLADMAGFFTRYYPLIFAFLAAFGIVLALLRPRAERAAALLPLLAAVSFTLAFNFVALRSEVRFFLPQTVFLAVYIGLAADWFAALPIRPARLAVQIFLAGAFVFGLYGAAAIPAAMANDPRYDTERFLAAHPGSIETYGLNVYLPRFPADATVTRLDLKPAKRRNPLSGVHDIDAPFAALAARHPHYIVVSRYWAGRFLDDTPPAGLGRITQTVTRQTLDEREARAYFIALFGEKLGYRIAQRAEYRPQFWPVPDGYESLAQPVYVFEAAD